MIEWEIDFEKLLNSRSLAKVWMGCWLSRTFRGKFWVFKTQSWWYAIVSSELISFRILQETKQFCQWHDDVCTIIANRNRPSWFQFTTWFSTSSVKIRKSTDSFAMSWHAQHPLEASWEPLLKTVFQSEMKSWKIINQNCVQTWI